MNYNNQERFGEKYGKTDRMETMEENVIYPRTQKNWSA